MLERSQLCGLDNNTVTDDAYFITAFDLTFTHDTTGNSADFGDMEGLQHFECCRYLFLHLRSQHTFHCRFHLVDSIVDDGVDTDIHFFGLCHLTGCTGRTNIEADDDGVRCRSQHDITVADGADCTMDDVDLDVLR